VNHCQQSCYNDITIRLCKAIGHPQGAPLRWVCLVCAFDFMHEKHEWHDVSYMNNIVLFVYSCRNENILIIRCHQTATKTPTAGASLVGAQSPFKGEFTALNVGLTARTGTHKGCPCGGCVLTKANNFILLSVLQPDRAPTRGAPAVGVFLQRRITLYYCRSYSPIGHPQGAPLRWMCSDCIFCFTHERHEINDY